MNKGFILGIDPDVSKSGIALLDCEARRFRIVEAYDFADLLRTFGMLMEDNGLRPLKVVIEDSWSTTHNWHMYGMSLAKAAALGRSVGLCHATGMHINTAAKVYGLDTLLMTPLKKMWKGRDGKITQEEIAAFIPEWPRRANQEERDAALLAWNYAGFPIRIAPK